jgi:hypothetical protein
MRWTFAFVGLALLVGCGGPVDVPSSGQPREESPVGEDAGPNLGSPGVPAKATPDRPSAPSPNSATLNEADQPPVDNTAINARDRAADAVTPLQQGQSQADVSTTAEIRRRIMADNLSLNAQNVKIVTRNGRVTLRGPVASDVEKSRIAQFAADAVGPTNVLNQLDVNRRS